MNNEMMKWTMKWWNEQWNDEINKEIMKWTMKWWNPRRVKYSVKHTEWPSALAYDEMNIHVK